jgi:hypothetical protein
MPRFIVTYGGVVWSRPGRTLGIVGVVTVLLLTTFASPARAAVPVASCILSGGKQRLTYTAQTSGWPANGQLGTLTLTITRTGGSPVPHTKNWVGAGTQLGPTTVTALIGEYTAIVQATKGSESAFNRCGPTRVRPR